MANRRPLISAPMTGAKRISKVGGLVCCVWLAISLAVQSGAQDDPFGMPADVPGFDDAAPAIADGEGAAVEDEPPESPLSIQLEQQAGMGSVPLAQSVAALARIGYWKKVDALLTQASARGIDDATLSEMGRRIGPALLIRMRQREDLSDKSHDLLRRISAASNKVAQAPARIIQAIAQLDSPSVDTQLAAIRTLLAGGNAAVQELAHAAVAENPAAPRDEILRLLIRFGPTSYEAFERLALYGKPEIRKRAVDALVRMGHRPVALEVLTALYATDSTEAERTSAAQHLMTLRLIDQAQSLPDRRTVLQTLVRDLQKKREAALTLPDDQQTETLWMIGEGPDRVSHQTASTVLKRSRDVADAAARIRRLGTLPSGVREMALSADLSYRVMVDPDWGDPDQIQEVTETFRDAVTATSLSGAISQSLRDDDVAALVALSRFIQSNVDQLDARVLLAGSGREPSPLVRAVDHPDPRVRYEAAIAVTRLAPSVAGFPGSTRVRLALDEMRSLGQLPIAVLVETRPDVVISLETLLTRLGYQVVVAPTVRQAERLVSVGGDVRLIVSKTQLADLPPIELIDRVRRHPRSREIPIVFFGKDSRANEVALGISSDRWDAITTLIDRPVTTAAFSPVREAMERRRRLPPLTRIDRQRYRETASAAMAQLAAL